MSIGLHCSVHKGVLLLELYNHVRKNFIENKQQQYKKYICYTVFNKCCIKANYKYHS